jgi:plastocyanin
MQYNEICQWEDTLPQTRNIEITAMAFPDNTDVEKGDTVVWTNRMNMCHTVTADDGGFDSGVLGKDQSFSQTFDALGSIGYHCEIHPNMTGTITITQPGPKTHSIEITAMAFPDDIAIAVGDTVVWTNRMNMNHTVTADNGEFDSGVLGQNQSFSKVFNSVGTFTYQCQIHPDMTGKVSVSS